MAVIILLGAGASFGSGGVEPYAPPLGNELFGELEKLGGEAAAIPSNIKKTFKENFEAGMAEYYEYTNGDIMSFQRELASYLASFQPLDDNIYLQLIKALPRQRVIFSSLNYDLLLELSASKLGLTTNYSTRHNNKSIRLLKIHGSSNFWPDIPPGIDIRGAKFSGSKGADIETDVKPLNQVQTLQKCSTDTHLSPAISMFAEGKQVKVCSEYVKYQYDMWLEQVKKSSKIFIIGVRVHQIDEHIWKVLGECKATITYFGFPKDSIEFDEWKASHGKKNAYFCTSDFKNSIETIKARAR
ncbi:hypothetical protein M634_13240 [Vibrio parahaemolyticus O1:Kuk str. FDA_R31]|uniref:hypothetical protein n=1 Tax=Vibrio harveyi group TaxID=717610 RepID=UPI0003591080|nr:MULTISPECIES: hypothetical protein [Vibrio harveyi group]AGQ92443.1 hypothetical protein M634_13240 [Vibrio parahaemolyticus O1:Kuk str. FDA_R31]EJB0393469.1 hypothetical protein [Vibrio parahaemolyticus]EJG2012824.1 hypothetical protein [Vibrio parahaemolyticus]EJG2026565.1 hypothetical protein [Vibrio parahaemolyticus]ODW68709.1 hypothetical protein BBL89_08575 [Vibrio parahaemolyticus]